MSTLLVERLEDESVLFDDAVLAERMQERVSQRCARLPQLSSASDTAGELHYSLRLMHLKPIEIQPRPIWRKLKVCVWAREFLEAAP